MTTDEKNKIAIDIIMNFLLVPGCDHAEFWDDYDMLYYDEELTHDQLDEVKDVVLERLRLKQLH